MSEPIRRIECPECGHRMWDAPLLADEARPMECDECLTHWILDADDELDPGMIQGRLWPAGSGRVGA